LLEDITVEEFMKLLAEGGVVPIDVRSPGEFAEGSVPGAMNIPLFDDEERRIVGITYKQVSVDAAKDKGLDLVSAKLPSFIRELQSIPGRKAFFCWRGGMRSRTSATLYSLVGGKVYRVLGGFRAYRRWVVETLETWKWTQRLIVINGFTGTGKTRILQNLHEKGYPVLDLEGIAAHRGSIFGGVGLEPNNQRTFDSLLVQELIRLRNSPYVVIEGESRRIGKAVMPDFLFEAKERAEQLFIEMPTEERVRNILLDYKPELHREACLEAFGRIERKIHTPVAAQIRGYMERGEFTEAVALLLEYYYDDRYEYTINEYAAERVTIEAKDIAEATMRIEAYLKRTARQEIAKGQP
jgi:tRNA 2-selenouridine synthase